MILKERFDGSSTPFEGDTTLLLKSLPEGARVSKTTLKLTPRSRVANAPFEEVILFNGGREQWGATLNTGGNNNQVWSEIDFHTRRTLTRVEGGSVAGCSLQMDLGGMYIELNDKGAALADGDTAFEVPSGGAVPGLSGSRFKLTRASTTPSISRVTVRSAPTNLTARLGSNPPFYSRPGELVRPENTPDFVVFLQTFLNEAKPEGGFYQIPLIIHSDSITRLEVEWEVEFTIEQNALPAGLPETTLSYGQSGGPPDGSASIEVVLPVGARVIAGQTSVRVQGAFQDSRIVFGPTGVVTPAASLPLTPAVSQAAAIQLQADQPVTSFDLLLASVSRTASLNVNIMEDVDGKVWNEVLLPRPVVINLDRDLAQTATWITAELPVEFQFKAGERYWLVIQCLSGEAAWGAATAAPGSVGMQNSSDGGLSWRTSSATGVSGLLDGLLRLRNVPGRFTMPVELLVGEGDNAQRVDLSRFEPLGRVDFILDTQEVAAAFNQVMASSEAGNCPRVNHLENNRFSAWQRNGDDPGAVRQVDQVSNARLLAMSADGCRAFVACEGDFEGSNLAVQIIDVTQEISRGTVTVSEGSPVSVVCNPEGSRVYLAANSVQVHVVDADQRADLGSLNLNLGDISALAISPDGLRLYVAVFAYLGGMNGGRVYTLSTPAFDRILTGNLPVDGAILGAPVELGGNRQVVGMVVSPDGASLHIAVARVDQNGQGELYQVDTADGLLVGQPRPLNASPRRVCLSSDGTRLLLVDDGTNSLVVVNLLNFETDRIPLPDGSAPYAAVFSPEGQWAYVALNETSRVAVVNLESRRVVRQIQVGSAPNDLAITPFGERVFVADRASDSGNQISLIPVGVLLPEEWTLTAGRVAPCCLPNPFGRAAALGDIDTRLPGMSAGLSQVVPASGGCRYEFSFIGLASDRDAFGEVLWISDACGLLQTDRVPVLSLPNQLAASSKNSFPLLSILRAIGQQLPEAMNHRAVLNAPAGATQAEVRFSAPLGVLAVLDNVSLQATGEVLGNTDLRLVENERLTGWQVQPENPRGVSLISDDETVQIHNSGSQVLSLSQKAAFEPSANFLLEFSGSSLSRPSARGNPALQLTWLNAAGQQAAAPVVVEITPGGSERFNQSGVAPAGASQAEVRLSVPPGAALAIRRVSLQPAQVVRIPVSFVAQAPGDLTISDWKVAYEMAEPSPPRQPAGGLCNPTRPGGIPGEADDCCYCPCCHGEHDLLEVEETHTPSGKTAHKGKCSNCGCQVTRGGSPPLQATLQTPPTATLSTRPAGQVLTGLRMVRVQPRVEAVQLLAVAAVLPEVQQVERIPVEAVKGIQEKRAAQLRELGIDSVQKLAAAKAEDISVIRGVSRKMALNWIEEAGRLQWMEMRMARKSPR